jgi:hypothetical protein
VRKTLLGIVLLLHCAVVPANDQEASGIYVTRPGDPLLDTPTRIAADHWKAVSILDGYLVISEVSSTVEATDYVVEESPHDYGSQKNYNELFAPKKRPALKLPADALLAFRHEEREDTQRVKAGRYATMVPSGTVISDGWHSDLRIGEKRWRIEAEYQRRKDGRLLAGSMVLTLAEHDGTNARELLPRANNQAFERQELLWLGNFNADDLPEMVLKRTWITGEIDHVLIVGSRFYTLNFDPDSPYAAFSSGVEESFSITRPLAQTNPFPAGKFGAGAFSVPEQRWNGVLDQKPELPLLLEDRTLPLDGEPVRFSFEYVPMAQTDRTSIDNFWGGPILVRVHFRGKSQVLMQTGFQDGEPFRVQVDLIQGKPAIQVSHRPHYNNSFTRYWIHDGTRFRRLSIQQDQGC